MSDRSPFFTRTMAKVHSDQGNFDKAVEIYRFLVQKEPGNAELAGVLEALESQMQQRAEIGLEKLFTTWLDLMLALKRLNELKRLKGGSNNQRRDLLLPEGRQ